MAKYVTICIRIAFGLLGVSFLLALVVSFLVESHRGDSLSGATRWDAITVTGPSNQPGDVTCCYLIDRVNQHCDALPLPAGNRWGQLSISPWRDADGNTEAVCQGLGVPPRGDARPFWGFARFRLPDGQVLDEVSLDILPVGRACWVPTRPGRVLFSAGDGKLYLYDFPGWSLDPNEPGVPAGTSSSSIKPTPVSWKGPSFLHRSIFIADPVWPSHSRIRNLVFATAIPQDRPRSPSATELWWLQMSDDGTVIEAAGLLEAPALGTSPQNTGLKRFPSVEVGRDGTARLIYLARNRETRMYCLEVIPLEIDPAAGHPRVPAHCVPRVLDENCALAPPLFAADGMTVYMISGNTGLIVKRQIESDIRARIHVASSD